MSDANEKVDSATRFFEKIASESKLASPVPSGLADEENSSHAARPPPPSRNDNDDGNDNNNNTDQQQHHRPAPPSRNDDNDNDQENKNEDEDDDAFASSTRSSKNQQQQQQMPNSSDQQSDVMLNRGNNNASSSGSSNKRNNNTSNSNSASNIHSSTHSLQNSSQSHTTGSPTTGYSAFMQKNQVDDELYSLWSCCSHPSSCSEAMFCCPCQIQRQLSAIQPEKPSSFNGFAPLYAITWFFVVPAIKTEVALKLAQSNGSSFSPQSSANNSGCCTDWIAGACCPCLSLALTFRQLSYLGQDVGGCLTEPYIAANRMK